MTTGMLVFRSLVLGLLGACCLLVATRPQSQLMLTSPPQIVVLPAQVQWHDRDEGRESSRETAAPVTVIDVAPGVTGELLATLIVLAANEHITAIDDAPVHNPRMALASLELKPHKYIDVSIASDVGATRRVLVLAR